MAGCVVPMITVPSYDRRGKKVSGAVIEFDKLQQNVAYEKIKVFSDNIRCHDSELLGPSGIFRKGQAQDRFKYSCQQIKQPFKGEPGSGPNFVEIKKRVDKREADLALNEMEKRNGGTSVVVTQKTASTLKDADSDDDVQAAPKTSVRSQGQVALNNIRRIGAKRKTTPVEVAESVMASARSSASAFGGSQCGDDTTPSKKSSRLVWSGFGKDAAAGASVVSLADSSDGNGGEQDTLDIIQILNGAQLGREFRKVFFSVIVNG